MFKNRSIAITLAILATVTACQAQQDQTHDAATTRILQAPPAYNDDWAVATLTWLRDQDAALLYQLGEITSDEGVRIIAVQRQALREQARAIVDGHQGALPADLAAYFPARR